jgi:hypothetical protein
LISAGAGDQAIILANRCSVMPLKCLAFVGDVLSPGITGIDQVIWVAK